MGVDPTSDAIDVHSRQAPEFVSSYEELTEDPYGSSFTYSRMRLEEALDRHLPMPEPGSRALDVGCGTGHHMRALAARGYSVSGVDGSEAMLAAAREANPDAEIELADVQALPFDDASFDLVLCIEVLRYLSQPERCIAEMARVLRPGGVCLATAAPRFSLNGYAAINRVAMLLPIGDLVRLKQFFTTSNKLRRQFSAAHFSDIEVEGVYTGPINWVEHLSARRLPQFLRRWQRVDRRISDGPIMRDLSNMLLVRAQRAT